MPSDLIHFVESPGFTKRIDKLASLDVLFSLQSDLVKDPLLGDLMEGCGGARKARVADKGSGKGKSGGFRYVYLYIEIAGIIYLLHFFGKNEKADLSKAERNEVAKLVRELKRLYGKKD
ncbi:MAG TPA: type II toxin-antitoxin system RelE/ParE family toxin [Pyrinomonadaceae bacterium]|nr:type II toxin-antitoxin system RelE/ParE family toxin [Pyrinomonadaceae bacterium]HMP65947.1 type II toxin-antitoxin system RelE/ParE family toxin [Pyrinomonadaceae bacterium]